MADRVWQWRLETGETVVAKIDPSAGTETVFLGERLVSRSKLGATPDGHDVRPRGATDGAYRGAKQSRVFFAKDDCRLEIDGEVIAPAAAPKSKATIARERRQLIGIIVALVLAAVMIVVTVRDPGPRGPKRVSGWSRFTGADPAATAASPVAVAPVASVPPRLPSTETHRSSNGLLTFLYPKDFSVTDTMVGEGASVVHLSRNNDRETMELFSSRTTDILDLWKLDASIQAASERSWPARDTRTVDVERSDGTCHGETAAITLRHISVKGNPVRQWSCVFVREGHAFRLTTFTPDWLVADELYLRSLVEAVTL